MTLSQVKARQPGWFSRKNKKFFNDVSYRVLHAHGKPYLVRSTYMWSDMGGQPQKLSWRINPLGEDGEIQPLLDKVFTSLDDVKFYLKNMGE